MIACDNMTAKYEYAKMLNVGDRETMPKHFLDELEAVYGRYHQRKTGAVGCVSKNK